MGEARPPAGPDGLEILIRGVEFFRNLDRVSCARIVGALEEVSVPEGTALVLEGSEADALYLVEAGEVSVSVHTPDGERSIGRLSAPAHFGEMGLLTGRRTASVYAVTDVCAWRLSRQRFEQAVRDQPKVALEVAVSLAQLIDHRARTFVGAPIVEHTPRPIRLEPPRSHRSPTWRVVGAVLALAVPLALWRQTPPVGLGPEGWHILLVVVGAAIGWVFEPVPDFVIALAVPAAWGIAGLVRPAAAFAGFASSSWIMAVVALALAAAMLRSGLLLRLALLFLRAFPVTHAGQVTALLSSGMAITPLLPSPLARVAAIAPLTQELAESVGYPARSRARAGLFLAGLIGYGSFSAMFLTGLILNLLVLDLLPAADRVSMGWLRWFAASIPATIIIFAGALVTLLFVLRPEVAPRMTVEMRRREERALGALSRPEGITLVALGVLLAGQILGPVARIDATWGAVISLIILTAGGALSRQHFRESIEWSILVMLGVLFGTAGVMHQVGIDRWLSGFLTPLAQVTGGTGGLLVVLGMLVILVRLALPAIPTILLLTLTLVPAASQIGLSGWPVGLVVLIGTFTWVNPRQYEIYRLAQEVTRGEMSTDPQSTAVGIAMAVVALLAIAASVPYWRALGLLV